jgi:hypothetical protein
MFGSNHFVWGFLNIYFYLLMCFIQHCFICRPSDSTVSEDAGIEPRTGCDLLHWQSGVLTIRLDLIYTRLDLIQISARSHTIGWISYKLYFWLFTDMEMDMVTEGLREVGGDKSDDDAQVRGNHSYRNLREALGRTPNYFVHFRNQFFCLLVTIQIIFTY